MSALTAILDPHSRALLDRSAMLAADIAPEALTVALRRSIYRATNALFNPSGQESPIRRENLSINLPGRSLPARVYQSADTVKTAAQDVLLVFFHGGGWVVGDLETHDHACAFLAQQLGCTLLSVEYRKAPEHPFPAPCDDAQAAYAWAWSQRSHFACKRIAVCGDSAGGHLAGHAMFANADVPTAAYGLFYPVADMNFANVSYAERGAGPGLTHAGMVWFWQQLMGSAVPSQDARAVLMRQSWQRKPPPGLVSVAWHDPLHDEGVAYARLLERAGGQVQLFDAQDMAHGFLRQCLVNEAAQRHVARAASGLLRLLT